MKYKGLEVCNPETCDCWDIRAVPEIIDILRELVMQRRETPIYSDQELAGTAVKIIEAMTPPKERYK